MATVKKILSESEQHFLLKIGFRIGYFCKLRKMTQQELANSAGISINTLSHIESTAITGLSLITVHRLAVALDIEPKQLLDFD